MRSKTLLMVLSSHVYENMQTFANAYVVALRWGKRDEYYGSDTDVIDPDFKEDQERGWSSSDCKWNHCLNPAV